MGKRLSDAFAAVGNSLGGIIEHKIDAESKKDDRAYGERVEKSRQVFQERLFGLESARAEKATSADQTFRAGESALDRTARKEEGDLNRAAQSGSADHFAQSFALQNKQFDFAKEQAVERGEEATTIRQMDGARALMDQEGRSIQEAFKSVDRLRQEAIKGVINPTQEKLAAINGRFDTMVEERTNEAMKRYDLARRTFIEISGAKLFEPPATGPSSRSSTGNRKGQTAQDGTIVAPDTASPTTIPLPSAPSTQAATAPQDAAQPQGGDSIGVNVARDSQDLISSLGADKVAESSVQKLAYALTRKGMSPADAQQVAKAAKDTVAIQSNPQLARMNNPGTFK